MRQATLGELKAIARSLGEHDVPERVRAMLLTGFTYVLPFADRDGGLAGAAHIEFSEGRGQLQLLLIHPDADAGMVEPRMIGVAEALTVAHGCQGMDIEAWIQ